jgi:thiamine-phosphate diphosphorylase
MLQNLATHLRLMLVTDDRLLGGRDPVTVCRQAEQGGVTAVQLRLKHASAGELVELARRLQESLHVPVIVNDRADVARAAGCWVHLGGDDLPVAKARVLFPPGAIIGGSVGSPDEAARAGSADYWGIGPLNGTSTKPDAGQALGVEGFARLVTLAAGRPCIAIGGVQPEDVPRVFAAGGSGVAVVSGILGSDDIEAAAREYASRLPKLGTAGC